MTTACDPLCTLHQPDGHLVEGGSALPSPRQVCSPGSLGTGVCASGLWRRVLAMLLAVAVMVAAPRRASAIFGEEDWISGQNQILTAMLVTELESTASLGTIITNIVQAVRVANETLAVARSVKRVYEAIVNYDLEKLKRDALQGLYMAVPEARELDREVRELIGNGRAAQQGSFWTHVGSSDFRMQGRSKALFDLTYQGTIWPLVFGDRHRKPDAQSEVDKQLYARFRRTGQLAQKATQRGAYKVLAQQVKAFVEDAERKPQVDLKMQATQTQLELQQAQDLTDLVELKKIDAAEQEALRSEASEFYDKLGKGLGKNAKTLLEPPGAMR